VKLETISAWLLNGVMAWLQRHLVSGVYQQSVSSAWRHGVGFSSYRRLARLASAAAQPLSSLKAAALNG